MLLNAILLEIQSDPSTVFVSKLTEQVFSIVLLVFVTWALWKRITKVQDRMDQYLSEDRKEMSEVIKNNTIVMNSVKEIVSQLKYSQK